MTRAHKTALLFGACLVVLFGFYSATVKVDFPVYYNAGAQALDGDLNLYPEQVSSEGSLQSTHYFRAAPAVAWLFVPFAVLPLEAASFLFFLLKVAGLLGIVVIVGRVVGVPHSSRWKIGLGALAAAAGYMIEEMRYGNAHLLVLFGMVWALYLAHRGRVLLPAALLAVAIAIKLTPLLLVAYLAITLRVKVAIATLAIFAALLLVPAVALGVTANTRLLERFVASAARMGDQPRNHSVRGVIVRYLTTTVPEAPEYPRVILMNLSRTRAIALWTILAATLAGLLVMTLRHPTRSPDAVPLKDALVLLAMLLLSTHTQRIYFSMLFFPFCVLMALLVKHPASRYARPIRWVIAASVVLGTVLPVVLPGRRLSFAYEMGSPYLFVTLAVFVLTVVLIRRADDIDAIARPPRSTATL